MLAELAVVAVLVADRGRGDVGRHHRGGGRARHPAPWLDPAPWWLAMRWSPSSPRSWARPTCRRSRPWRCRSPSRWWPSWSPSTRRSDATRSRPSNSDTDVRIRSRGPGGRRAGGAPSRRWSCRNAIRSTSASRRRHTQVGSSTATSRLRVTKNSRRNMSGSMVSSVRPCETALMV